MNKILKPNKGEKKNDYVNRFLADVSMREQYSDIKQRFLISSYEWLRANSPKKAEKV